MSVFIEIAQRVGTSGKVEASDIAALRRAIYQDGVVSRAEGEALFGIERVRTAHSDAWSQLFVEALTDYAIKQEPPAGYLSGDTAAWITAEISKRKQPSTDAEIELVINLIEQSREVPAAFASFALRLVKDMVMYADGPLPVARIEARCVDAYAAVSITFARDGSSDRASCLIKRSSAFSGPVTTPFWPTWFNSQPAFSGVITDAASWAAS